MANNIDGIRGMGPVLLFQLYDRGNVFYFPVRYRACSFLQKRKKNISNSRGN